MNFENKIIKIKPIPLIEKRDLLNELFVKKQKIVDDFRIDEKEFVDIYSEEQIQNDLLEIKNIENTLNLNSSKQEKENRKIASLLEGVIVDQVEANEWLGEDCEIIPASRYDDIKNGIDIIGIFNKKNVAQHLGLAIDVTFASNHETLFKKLNSIKATIYSANSPKLKYFRDPETGQHKVLYLPKVIIGTRLSSAEKLLILWGSKEEGKNKKLKEDPMQAKIILESLYQLKYFYEYALSFAKNTKEKDKIEKYKEIASNYAQMYNVFFDIYESKKELIEKHINEVVDDIVYQTIAEYTGYKEKEEK